MLRKSARGVSTFAAWSSREFGRASSSSRPWRVNVRLEIAGASAAIRAARRSQAGHGIVL